MRRFAVVAALAVLLALASVPVVSAGDSSVGTFADLGLVSSQIGSGAADQAGIGSRGYGGLLGFGVHFTDYVVIGVSGEYQWVQDNDPLGNDTTDGYKTSSTGVYTASFYAGLRTPFLGKETGFRVGLDGGWTVAGGRRSISDCMDCDEEGLSIKGGPFVRPSLFYGKRHVGCTASYSFYGKQSDIRNTFMVSLTVWK